jgi:hypothetical protein
MTQMSARPAPQRRNVRWALLVAFSIGALFVAVMTTPVLAAPGQARHAQRATTSSPTQVVASGTGVIVNGQDASTSFCEVASGVTSITSPPSSASCKPSTPSHPFVVTNNDGEGTINCATFTTNLPWCGTVSGAAWDSLNKGADDSSNPPPAFYVYDATFSVCQTAGTSLSGSMLADDSAGVFLNNTLLTSMPDPVTFNASNYTTPTPFSASTGFTLGSNTLAFVVHDTASPYTGLDYRATISSPTCDTISCSSVKGKVTFVPPLVNGGTASDEAKISVTVSNCVGSGGATLTSGKGTSSGSLTTDSCSNLNLSTQSGMTDSPSNPLQNLDIKFRKKVDADVTFGAYTQAAGVPDFGWSLGGPGTTVTGSDQGTDGGASSTAQYVSTLSTAKVSSDCAGAGLKSLKIASGSLTLK